MSVGVQDELRSRYRGALLQVMRAKFPAKELEDLKKMVLSFESSKLYAPFHGSAIEYCNAANKKLLEVDPKAQAVEVVEKKVEVPEKSVHDVYWEQRAILVEYYEVRIRTELDSLRAANSQEKVAHDVMAKMEALIQIFGTKRGADSSMIKLEDMKRTSVKCLDASKILIMRKSAIQQKAVSKKEDSADVTQSSSIQTKTEMIEKIKQQVALLDSDSRNGLYNVLSKHIDPGFKAIVRIEDSSSPSTKKAKINE